MAGGQISWRKATVCNNESLRNYSLFPICCIVIETNPRIFRAFLHPSLKSEHFSEEQWDAWSQITLLSIHLESSFYFLRQKRRPAKRSVVLLTMLSSRPVYIQISFTRPLCNTSSDKVAEHLQPVPVTRTIRLYEWSELTNQHRTDKERPKPINARSVLSSYNWFLMQTINAIFNTS